MAESSRRFRNSTSRSIAASSVIALALGGISIVGPGPLASSAAASEGFTGGLYGADGTGAIAKDDQLTSDLEAGSCAVGSTAASGSQAGFKWKTSEPGPGNPGTKWGLSVSFDNSQDRTFTDWYFENTANLTKVLNPGTVPPLNVDGVLPGHSKDPVTAKADESIAISKSGRDTLNLGVYAKLDEEKVAQFAGADADNPVRYAWVGEYKTQVSAPPVRCGEW